jgi:hypothetical protein
MSPHAMSNNGCQQEGVWTLGNILTQTEQAAWERLHRAEAELEAARWAVIEVTNCEASKRTPVAAGGCIASNGAGRGEDETTLGD